MELEWHLSRPLTRAATAPTNPRRAGFTGSGLDLAWRRHHRNDQGRITRDHLIQQGSELGVCEPESAWRQTWGPCASAVAGCPFASWPALLPRVLLRGAPG